MLSIIVSSINIVVSIKGLKTYHTFPKKKLGLSFIWRSCENGNEEIFKEE